MSEAIVTAPTVVVANPQGTPLATAQTVKATPLPAPIVRASPVKRFATGLVFAIAVLGGIACGMLLLFRNPDAAAKLGFGTSSGVTLITQHPDEGGQVLGVHVMAEQVLAAQQSVVIMGGRLRHRGLLDALVEVSKRGVRVIVILHDGASLNATRRMLMEERANIQIYITPKEFDDQIALIDESRVFVSGLGWSKAESQHKIGALTSSSDPKFVSAARQYLVSILETSRKISK